MGMGIDQWDWEGMGILIVFPHISNSNSAWRAETYTKKRSIKHGLRPSELNANARPNHSLSSQ